ncbi:MAG: hypothetical protein AAF460_14080, partial [Pseudomonadota bacterium]
GRIPKMPNRVCDDAQLEPRTSSKAANAVSAAFISDRPDHHYMHLGYGHHRCLGDHISTVQWPEMVRAVLRLNKARPVGDIDNAGGPFPEHYRIQVDG